MVIQNEQVGTYPLLALSQEHSFCRRPKSHSCMSPLHTGWKLLFCVGEYLCHNHFLQINSYISGLAKNLFPFSMKGEQAWMKKSDPISWTNWTKIDVVIRSLN